MPSRWPSARNRAAFRSPPRRWWPPRVPPAAGRIPAARGAVPASAGGDLSTKERPRRRIGTDEDHGHAPFRGGAGRAGLLLRILPPEERRGRRGALRDAARAAPPRSFLRQRHLGRGRIFAGTHARNRSEEHTSELQSRPHLVCRLLLEKKKKINTFKIHLNDELVMLNGLDITRYYK